MYQKTETIKAYLVDARYSLITVVLAGLAKGISEVITVKAQVNIDLNDDEKLNFFSGNKVPDTSIPIALNYSGHQFGNFVHELGDGRAVLLGEVRNKDNRYDVQLKGSGQTKFSRQGDGRSALGPVIREYILSEAMHHLGVPTSRALAAITTGEFVARETFEPGGILTREAKNHSIRRDKDIWYRISNFDLEFHSNYKTLNKSHHPTTVDAGWWRPSTDP